MVLIPKEPSEKPPDDEEKKPDPWEEFFQKAKQLGTAVKDAGPEGVVDIAYDGVDKAVSGVVSVSHLFARMGKRVMERTINSLEKGGDAIESAIEKFDEDPTNGPDWKPGDPD